MIAENYTAVDRFRGQ